MERVDLPAGLFEFLLQVLGQVASSDLVHQEPHHDARLRLLYKDLQDPSPGRILPEYVVLQEQVVLGLLHRFEETVEEVLALAHIADVVSSETLRRP